MNRRSMATPKAVYEDKDDQSEDKNDSKPYQETPF